LPLLAHMRAVAEALVAAERARGGAALAGLPVRLGFHAQPSLERLQYVPAPVGG
jgi:hypothetical protein